jgi:cob(I)alamin adenosyltransferase
MAIAQVGISSETLPCEGRRAMEKRLADAIAEVYSVKASLHVGKSDATSLTFARQAQRDAERKLRAHIEEHGCKKMS